MITALLLGLAAGSFTGVICYRIPRNESIIFPGSRCDNCKIKINFFHNIPILSFLLQKGKCRNCGKKIKKLYFLLEILIPFLFIFLYFSYGLSIVFFYKALTFTVLIAASFIDIETYVIPDRFYIILLIISFFYSVFQNDTEKLVSRRGFLRASLTSALLCF